MTFPASAAGPAYTGERPRLERLVVEEYILDTVASFQADRTECAKRLAAGKSWSSMLTCTVWLARETVCEGWPGAERRLDSAWAAW